MTFREVVKKLRDDGWIEDLPKTSGSHRHFHHPFKPGKVTVPEHKGKDIDLNTLKSIEKQSGLKLR